MKMEKAIRKYVNGMEAVGEKLNNVHFSGKTGAKIGMMLALNPVTAPITTGVMVGAGVLYGTYKIAKRFTK